VAGEEGGATMNKALVLTALGLFLAAHVAVAVLIVF
jgi:hypothetical protein